MFKPLNASSLATIFGIATSICTALAVVDLDTLNFSLVSTYFKLIILTLPAIGGYMSTITKPKR
tara:strand:- start:380 stop:571 length:192 start_codon:yes stop_codon:yes gene_type:complete